MKEDPFISSGILKGALVVIAVVALGIGAFALIGENVDLPDLPEVENSGGGPTNLENTTIEEGDFGDFAGADAIDLFTTAGFAEALDQVKAEAGSGQELTRLFINDVQTQFIAVRGDGVEAYSVRGDTGELERQEATVTISGSAELSDFAFPLD